MHHACVFNTGDAPFRAQSRAQFRQEGDVPVQVSDSKLVAAATSLSLGVPASITLLVTIQRTFHKGGVKIESASVGTSQLPC
jgi:hypothetical protein